MPPNRPRRPHTPAVAPLTSSQLDALVAPIALYPDALVAQVLAAASYADEVAFADLWLAQNQNLQGAALTQAVDQQSWDPSVKALTQFPSVLHNLAKNLSWTSSLGQAFENQQSDVMAAVQVMRAKAQAAGTLQSSSQIKVVQQSPQTIIIEPASSNVVYVPQYNPAVVYGAPLVVPAYTPPVAVAAGVSFGAGVAIGAAIGGGGFVAGGFGGGWGFGAWGMNWGGGAVEEPSTTTTTPTSPGTTSTGTAITTITTETGITITGTASTTATTTTPATRPTTGTTATSRMSPTEAATAITA